MKNLLIPLLALLIWSTSYGQNQKAAKLKIFVDCQTSCYQTFLKQNLKGVEFVRDPHDADVYILINAETNGSGGDTYYIETEGQKQYEGIKEKITFNTHADMQDEEIREKLLKYLKLVLARYWAAGGMDDLFDIHIREASAPVKIEDKWNNWVFRIGMNAYGSGDSNYSNIHTSTSLSARQVKEKHKFALRMRYSKGHQRYFYGTQIIKAVKESMSLSTSEVLAIDQHWSYGFFGGMSRSIYSNYRFSGYVNGGIEYNFFPYKESSKHMLTMQATVGPVRNIYFEKTIFGKTMETLWQSNLSISTNIIRKWGNIDAHIGYSQYVGHPALRSFDFYTGLQWRVVKGLNFHLSGMYAITHDKINIAAGGATLEEILLRQKELLSSYSFFVSTGLSYSFGSIYNTIVNPRFEGSGSIRVFYF